MDYSQSYLQQLFEQLRRQAGKIAEMDRELQRLNGELNAMKEKRTIHVERIEYKFDQLKIETLEGTLNIGISPGVGKQIEDLSIAGQTVVSADSENGDSENGGGDDGAFMRIKEQIDRYLATGCLQDLQRLEAEHRIVLGTEYKDEMIKDIRRQIDQRIAHYLGSGGRGGGSADVQAIVQAVVEKVKGDISAALESHVKSMKRGGNGDETDG
jgi:spore germination protein PC